MAKTKLTWRDLVTKIMQERKKKGEKPSLKDVAPEAQKEWASIKGGTHPLYEQGKATFNKSKKVGKASKKQTRKLKGKGDGDAAEGSSTVMDDAAQIISKCKLCKKCSKKVEKVYGAEGSKGSESSKSSKSGKGKKIAGGSGGTTANTNVPDSSFKSSEPSAVVTDAKVTQDLHAVAGGGKKKGGCGPSCGVMGGGTCAAHAAAPATP